MIDGILKKSNVNKQKELNDKKSSNSNFGVSPKTPVLLCSLINVLGHIIKISLFFSCNSWIVSGLLYIN